MKTDIYADYHVHTHLSPCGKPQATAAAMIAAAQRKGIVALGFADHFTPQPVPGCSFYDTQRLHVVDDLRREVLDLGAVNNVELLFGVEADYTLAGDACLDDAALANVDHVICAASHFHLPASPEPADDSPKAKADLQVTMAQGMLNMRGVSVWAHPFECSKMRPLAPILAEIPEATLASLIELAIQKEIAIEINGGGGLQMEYRSAIAPFMGLAREMGARFTLTADAHHPDDFIRLDQALEWAYDMGFKDQHFVTLPEFRAMQYRRSAAE